MKTYKEFIRKISIIKIFRTSFILIMSVYFSVGDLPKHLDCFEVIEIELAEENEAESKEKENKEEVEKDKFLSKLFSSNLLSQGNFSVLHDFNLFSNNPHKDIPTPPPKIAST